MSIHDTARSRFEEYDGKRHGIISRFEQYARWTIPKIFPDSNRNQDTDPLNQDYQSLGAQATNHLANRLMVSLFQPGRAFFRLELGRKSRKTLEEQGIDPTKLREMQSMFAQAETQASLELDKRSIRSKLYDLLKMLIVVGNAMMIFEKDTMRVLSPRNYVVKRTRDGKLFECIIKEKMHKDQLTDEVKGIVEGNAGFKPDPDDYTCQYLWIKKEGKKYIVETWVDEVKLPAAYTSQYSEQALPYHAVTWDLASGDDYGTGLVEDFAGDFQALSMLSRATVHAAILASEFRWLVNPAGQTSVEDFEESANGAAIPGMDGDIHLVHSGVESNLQTNLAIQTTYVERIGAGFLLQSAVTRHAERVTAEEIRRNAEELEGGLGGAYSRIAVDVQLPIAYWTMKLIDKSIVGSDVEPVVITGLAALSRMGDRDRLLMFGSNLANVLGLPPQILDRLKLSSWISDLAAAEGLDPAAYVLSEEEYGQMMQARQQAQLAQQNAEQQINNQNNMEQRTQ